MKKTISSIAIILSIVILLSCGTGNDSRDKINPKEEVVVSEGPFGAEAISKTFDAKTFEGEFGFPQTPDVKPICFYYDYSGIDGITELTFECNDQTFEKIIEKLGLTQGENISGDEGFGDKCNLWNSKKVKNIKYYEKQKKQFHWNLWRDKEKKIIHYSHWDT